ncbi:ATP-binding protein [Falsiroseomonas bella]|uniref:ATP-binding protein n=1 Tax=Falsiroseomonas bella TaxID=2184016 RepID=A0A317FEN6_9PROT|nr:ATP-binding protein [Falsiroseomonas bella]PWS37551.1 ATP-binding protein [Falsiroseomonas bella]
MTVRIEIGTTNAGAPATLDLEELLATRLLVQGNSGSGKSHLLRRLLEQSAPWVQQAVIDPEGDFVTLGDRFGHLVIDAAESGLAGLKRAADGVRRHRVSVVLNLENLEQDQQLRHAAAFLDGLFTVERDIWSPMLVVVDEAQLFAPAMGGDVSDEARRTALAAMTDLMCRGRKRGLAGVVATQRLAKLAKNVAAEASNFLMGRTFLDIDMARAADLLGMERRQAEMFRDLARGHFVALGPAITRRPLPVRIGDVETASRGQGPKLVPPPQEASEAAREMILKAAAAPEPRLAPQPRRPAAPPPDIATQLAAARPAPVHDRAEPPLSEEEEAARQQKLSDVLRAVLGEPEAAYRQPAILYQDFLVRCRIARLGAAPDLPAFRRLLSLARAGVAEQAMDDADWPAVAEQAAALPEDTQGVYLLLARAALAGEPCPSDAAIARAYGSRSAGRARRLLDWLETQGAILCRTDNLGRRIVALTGSGRETAPGDPAAEAA